MAWGRLHDRANGNAKLLALSDSAWRMWGCGLIYCQDNLTDGFIPGHAIHSFGVRARNKETVAAELCRSLVPSKGPLWHRVDGGYQVHDYLDWNDSAKEILAERERSRQRKERFAQDRKGGAERRSGRVPNAVPNGEIQGGGTGDPRTTSTSTSSTSSEVEQADSSHPIKDFLARHERLFLARFGTKPAKYTTRDAKIAKDTIDRFEPERAWQLLESFMQSTDEWVLKTGFGLNVFAGQVNKLVVSVARPKKNDAPRGSYTHTPSDCKHDPPCLNVWEHAEKIAKGEL